MKTVVETERIILRELVPADAEILALVLCDPASMRHYPRPFTRAEVERWVDRNIASYAANGFGMWGMVLKGGGELVGECGITLQEVEGERIPEVGYHVRAEWRGRGLATEAARACIDRAFGGLGLGRIYSYMQKDNVASRRVAERNGMVFQRQFAKAVQGVPVPDEVLYMLERPAAPL